MTTPALARRLGLGDAVWIGLGSMVGAGVFAAFGPAARAAGGGLLVGLLIAAVVALCNATSSAQLAARYPTSGGTYVYGRQELGPWWGFAAGWCFVIGKTASCAAMALTFAAYVTGGGPWLRPVAAAAVLALAALNLQGITRTAQLTRIIVVAVLAVLAVVLGLAVASPAADVGRLGRLELLAGGWQGIAQSAGLLFFAFAGYARIATMGEEVREPQRTIPRAIPLALGLAVAVYALVAVVLLLVADPAQIAGTATPLGLAARASGWAGADPLLRAGAALAALGALLSLIAGVGRTSLAMAREGDLPRALAAVDPRHQVPRRAEIALALVLTIAVLTVDLRGAIGFSSFGVLLYYAVANASALHQRESRRYPRALQWLGLIGCLVLAATLPPASVAAGAAVLAVGLLGRAWRLRRSGSN